MFGLYERSLRGRRHLRLRLLLGLLSLVLLTDSVAAQQNVTLDDADLFIMYAPATSWHASTVECDTCLSPPSSSAHGGTWHDGTHIIPTLDEDDEPVVGDLDGDGTTSASATPASTPASSSAVQPSSSSSPQPAQTSAATNISDNDDDDDGDDHGSDDDHGGKGKGDSGSGSKRARRLTQSAKWRRLVDAKTLHDKRDDENPFEVQDNDSDDPGFQDVPVTATVNFTGQAIYVFAIIPLFPAPPNTTPTFTNLSFTLDGASHGSFTFRPDPTAPGTPTVNSSDTDKFQPNVNVFSVADLDDTEHSLVVNVGVDSVFLLDYVIYTAGANDPTVPGSITTSAPGSDRTADAASDSERELIMSSSSSMTTPTPSTVVQSSSNHQNVATFAGAIGGSFGLLSAIALGLCISIKCRRRRAAIREHQRRAAIAQNFTARDHGDMDEGDDEESVFARPTSDPVMAQANPAPFVPRYFPGSLPTSPPPYAPDAEGERVVASSPMASINREGLPVAVPSTLPPMIALPTATLDLQRTTSNNSSNSYADRPPPTPPDEDTRISLFGPPGFREDRNLNGGIIGPLPIDTPTSEESDPMLGVVVDDPDREEDRTPARRISSESVLPPTFGKSRSLRSSGSSEPSGTTPSSSSTPHSLSTSSASSFSAPSETGAKLEDASTPSAFPTLSTSISLPSFSVASSSRLLTRPSFPDLGPKPTPQGGLSALAYPLLQPSRVPLPPSIYGTDVGSQETLERHDSRT